MCEKCAEINRNIANYQSTISNATDTLAIQLLGMVVKDLEADKKALHPEKDE